MNKIPTIQDALYQAKLQADEQRRQELLLRAQQEAARELEVAELERQWQASATAQQGVKQSAADLLKTRQGALEGEIQKVAEAGGMGVDDQELMAELNRVMLELERREKLAVFNDTMRRPADAESGRLLQRDAAPNLSGSSPPDRGAGGGLPGRTMHAEPRFATPPTREEREREIKRAALRAQSALEASR